MKYLVVALLSCISFLASSQVSIAAKTARYFLEVDDSLQIYKQKDSTNRSQITDLKTSIEEYKATVAIYQADSVVWSDLVKAQDEQIAFEKSQTKIAEKAARKARFKATLVTIGSVVVVILVII